MSDDVKEGKTKHRSGRVDLNAKTSPKVLPWVK
jgi:hypothetical protein